MLLLNLLLLAVVFGRTFTSAAEADPNALSFCEIKNQGNVLTAGLRGGGDA